jgi:hypothetical protein
MNIRTMSLAAVIVASGVCLDAHFVLMMPAASIEQSQNGDPQKVAPCGGVSANPTRGTPANPGVPTNAVTEVKGGSSLHLKVQETVYHPGHYRVALARTAAELPADPEVTTRPGARGEQSVSAVIQTTPAPPVIADGLFAHTERSAVPFETEVLIPNINCPKCVLQVIEFMAEHGRNADGDFSYHHCATVNVTADPAKPIDARWK